MRAEEKTIGGKKGRCAVKSLRMMQILGWRGRLNWVLHFSLRDADRSTGWLVEQSISEEWSFLHKGTNPIRQDCLGYGRV